MRNSKARPTVKTTAVSAGAALSRKLMEDDIPKPTKALGSESRQAIIRTRCDKKLNQTQLNTLCAFPLHTIRDIESAKLCPTPTQLTVLSRQLGLVLKYE